MEKRHIIECNLVFSLWKQPLMYLDYGQLQDDFFLTKEGLFYYSIGKDLFKSKFLKFDEIAISTYFNNKESLRTTFENYGGYSTVKEIMSIVEVDNVEAYFDSFIKGKVIKDLITAGIDVDLDLADSMTTDELYEHYDKILNSTFMANPNNFELEDMLLTSEDIDYWNQGLDMGIQFSEYCPRLNYHCMGIPKKEVSLLAGRMNNGKTTFAVSSILYPIAKRGDMVGMIANEQTIIKMKALLLSMIMFREMKEYSMSRRNIRKGNFTPKQIDILNKAKEKYNELLANKFKFVKMYDYKSDKLKKAVRLLASLGCSLVLYDVLKIDTNLDKNAPAWQELVNTSKDLLQLATKFDIAVLVSMQLDQNKVEKRIITSDALAGAKQVNEVVSEMFGLRLLLKDEYTGQQHDCKAYNFEYDKEGKLVKGSDNKPIKTYLELKEDETYLIVFHPKSRSDNIGSQILYKVIGDFATYVEIGYANVVEVASFKKGN